MLITGAQWCETTMKTIAITGGAGFLGSHLADRLIKRGHRIFVLDNFQTGDLRNLALIRRSGQLHIIRHDIIAPLPDDLPRFDAIYNLACPASPPRYQEDPIATLMTSSYGVKNVLDRALRDQARVFHASTSEIYGDPEVHPQPETYNGNVNPVGPRSCYDVGKCFAETMLTDFARCHGVTVRMERIFNTYGPRMQPDDGRVVSNFIVQALRGDDITIYGDGSQTRSFCYVDDTVEGLMRLMDAGDEAAGPMNIGNPVETPVHELGEMIVAMTGSSSKIDFRPLPVDDPRKRRPDISRAKRILDWSPKVDLVSGLKETIKYFSGEIAANIVAKVA